MDVAMVTPWGRVSGIASDSRHLVPALRRRVRVRVVEITDPRSGNPLVFWRLARQARSSGDLVHIQHEHGLFGRLGVSGAYTTLFYASLGRGRPVITTLHEFRGKGGVVGLARRVGNRFIFSFSDVIHVHTREAEQELLRILPRRKVWRCPLGSYATFVPRDKARAKRSLGLAGKKVVLLFGFVQREKGYEAVISQLPHLDSRAVVLVAGQAADRGYCRSLARLAERLGVADRIVWKGTYREEEAPDILAAADVAVLPYRDAAQSGALNHLMAYRIPTIASDIGFFREIQDEYGCLLLFRGAGQLAALLSRILRGAVPAGLARNCRRFTADRSPERIASRLAGLYHSLASERSHSRNGRETC